MTFSGYLAGPPSQAGGSSPAGGGRYGAARCCRICCGRAAAGARDVMLDPNLRMFDLLVGLLALSVITAS